MIKNRGKLKTIIALVMCASTFTSTNVFAIEKSETDKEISIENFKNVQAKSNSQIENYEFDTSTGIITKYKGSDRNRLLA